jgi:CheY-like chemotaxis protein
MAKKILVVEDEHDLQSLYVTVLNGAGYTTETASDGNEAYNKLKAGTYDLVLMDIMMPEMDGIQVLEKLQAEGKNNMPVVLLTNLGQDTLVAKALALGIRGYLVKSDYTPEQLLKEVKGYL